MLQVAFQGWRCYLDSAMEKHERWDEIWSAKQQLAAGRLTSPFTRDVIHRTVLGILRREVPEPQGKRILEVGSGSGLVSLALAKMGAQVTLCDISPEALRFSRAVFAKNRAEGEMIQGSILDLPFDDGAFDVTWNAGVIEHFEGNEQIQALREMLRVTKPGGSVVVAVPWAGARIYARAKAYADRRKMWQPGYEVPIQSFKDIAPKIPATVAYEYQTGFLAQLHFLKYYFARPAALRLAFVGFVEVLSLLLYPLDRHPGYLLVCVFDRRT